MRSGLTHDFFGRDVVLKASQAQDSAIAQLRKAFDRSTVRPSDSRSPAPHDAGLASRRSQPAAAI